MKKYIVVASVFMGVALVFFCIGNYISAQEQTPPETVTNEGGSFGKITWSHSAHMSSAECKECHHMGESPVKNATHATLLMLRLMPKAHTTRIVLIAIRRKKKAPQGAWIAIKITCINVKGGSWF